MGNELGDSRGVGRDVDGVWGWGKENWGGGGVRKMGRGVTKEK
jgi:hypothetical protein